MSATKHRVAARFHSVLQGLWSSLCEDPLLVLAHLVVIGVLLLFLFESRAIVARALNMRERLDEAPSSVQHSTWKMLGRNDYLVTLRLEGEVIQVRGDGRWWRTYPDGNLVDPAYRALLEREEVRRKWRHEL